MQWQDINDIGNTCFHLACASNDTTTVLNYLEFGVLIDMKNARGHLPADLTTNPTLIGLLWEYKRTPKCLVCDGGFQGGMKYLCFYCKGFFHGECTESLLVYQKDSDVTKTISQRRCRRCNDKIEGWEGVLEALAGAGDLDGLNQKLQEFDLEVMDKVLVLSSYKLREKLAIQRELLEICDSV